MSSPFQKGSPPLTIKQREALQTVSETEGMEYDDDSDITLNELRELGLISFGPKRGPKGEWFRVELTKAGESAVTKTSSAEKAIAIKAYVQQKLQNKQLESLNQIDNFDWKAVPPPMLAQMLVQMPFKGGAGEPDYFLAPWQAMVFAMRCFELGLSPFSNEVWFNPKNNKTNVTFEGKLKLARKNGLNLSPPSFKRIPEDASKPLLAYECTIKSPTGDCHYTAYLRDWQVPSSPVWKAKPDHMLQLRAAEKCLSFASGIGTSELPGEGDLDREPERAELPTIESTNFNYKEMENKQ